MSKPVSFSMVACVAAVIAACSTSSDDHFSCSLNGTCYKCPSSDAVSKCSIQTGPGPGCEKTDTSYCKK